MRALAAIVALLAGLFGALCLFTVDERELAVVLELGRIHSSDYEPGLHVKWPYPYQHVEKFDKRIQNLDAAPTRFLTSEKKNVMVDAFVKWRIQDVERFYRATSGGNMDIAAQRLSTVVQNRLRNEFGKRTVREVVSGERTEIMHALMVEDTTEVNLDAVKDTTALDDEIRENLSARQQAYLDLGVRIEDVRVKRIDWPEDVSPSVYNRMEAERKQVAKDFRARGEEKAKEIRAQADRMREVIIAEANRESEQIRGEGDAVAAETYAGAFGRNPEFYALYRSLNAYRNTLNSRSDILLMRPDTEFFKYFKDPTGIR